MTILDQPDASSSRARLACERLFVPVRINDVGIDVLVTGHLPDGTRTAIAFTSPTALARAMGGSQAWIRLSSRGIRGLMRSRGVLVLRVDPDLVAPDQGPGAPDDDAARHPYPDRATSAVPSAHA